MTDESRPNGGAADRGPADHGIATAAREVLATRPQRPERAEQLDLDFLGLPAYRDHNGVERRPEPVTLPESDKPHGRGSRAGIRNRRTEEWIDYFAHRYRLPLEGLVAISNLAVDDLCKSLKCSPLEAMNVKLRALESAAPYLHPKLASIEVKPAGHPGGAPATLTIDGTDAQWAEVEGQ